MASDKALERRPDTSDLTAVFRIDANVRALWERRRMPRFEHLEDAIRFGRYALDKAAKSAIAEGEMGNYGRNLKEWRRASQLALAAATDLSRLLTWLGTPNGDPGIRLALRHLRTFEGTPASTLYADAARDLRQLRQAEAIVNRFETFTRQVAERFPKEDMKLGHPAKVEFVFRLAEAWLVMTGKLPSPNKTLTSNPFMRFALNGWLDVNGQADGEESFAQSALQRALARLSQVPERERATFRPEWWANAGAANLR